MTSTDVAAPGRTTSRKTTWDRTTWDREACGCGWAGCTDGFRTLAAAGPDRRRIRNGLVERHLGLARTIAGHFRHSGAAFEDVVQVASLAVVEAVDRFDPARGVPFSAFATPTVSGSIKRYFRDSRWTVQPPRRIKELYLEIRSANDGLTQRLGQPPAVAGLAARLGRDRREVLEALCAADGLRPVSLDAPAATDHPGARPPAAQRALGADDAGYERIEYRESLHRLLGRLPDRELRALTLRYFGNLTQAEIGERLGC